MAQPHISFDDYLHQLDGLNLKMHHREDGSQFRSPGVTQSLSSPWGRFDLPKGRTDRWLIRNLELVITHTEHHWIVRNRHVLRKTPDTDHAHRRVGLTESEFKEELYFDRIAHPVCPIYNSNFQTIVVPALPTDHSGESLLFSPLLPELPVLIQLLEPMVLDPGEVSFVIGQLPLEIRIDLVSTHSQSSRELSEVRIEPLSDAWSSNSPHEGELCLSLYRPFADAQSIQSQQVERAADLGFGARPSTTAAKVKVTVYNPTAVTQILSQFLIPASQLNLYHCSEEGFWSSDLVLTPDEAPRGTPSIGSWKVTPDSNAPSLARNPRLTTASRAARPEGERSKKSTGAIAGWTSRIALLFRGKA